jgi:Leucine-rich repeat (LRR) protein
LDAASFNNLSQLIFLYLGNNQLSGQVNKELFQDLVKLKTLDLSNNSLASIAEGAFQSQAVLKLLNLSGNTFSSPLDPNVFVGLPAYCEIKI